MRNILLASAIITAVVGLTNVAMADPFSMGSNSIGSIGDEIDSGFDTLTVTGNTGTTNDLAVASIGFNAGYNCNECNLTPHDLLSITLTIGGMTQSFSLPWSWYSTSTVDYLNFAPIAPLNFDLAGGEVVSVAFDTPASLSSAGGVVSEDLDAQFAIPEPMSLALFGAGLLGIGLFRRRRT